MSTLSVKWDLWVNPFVAISVFVLLGLTREARATYGRLFWRVMRPLGIKGPPAQIFVTSEMRFGTVGGRDVTFNDSRWVHTYYISIYKIHIPHCTSVLTCLTSVIADESLHTGTRIRSLAASRSSLYYQQTKTGMSHVMTIAQEERERTYNWRTRRDSWLDLR